jgi:hypothetical protein
MVVFMCADADGAEKVARDRWNLCNGYIHCPSGSFALEVSIADMNSSISMDLEILALIEQTIIQINSHSSSQSADTIVTRSDCAILRTEGERVRTSPRKINFLSVMAKRNLARRETNHLWNQLGM